MDRRVKIEKVNRDNMSDFLLLLEGLAHYEDAEPPDDSTKRRLEIDALSKNPPFQAFVAYLGDKPVATSFIITPTPRTTGGAFSSSRTSS